MSTPVPGSPNDGRAFADGAALSLPVVIDSTHNTFQFAGTAYVIGSDTFGVFDLKRLCRALRDAEASDGSTLGDVLDVHPSPWRNGAIRFTASDAGVNTSTFTAGPSNDCLARVGFTAGAALANGFVVDDSGVRPDPALLADETPPTIVTDPTPDPGPTASEDEVVALQGQLSDLSGQVSALTDAQSNNGWKTAVDLQWAGAAIQGGYIPAAAGIPLPVGNGTERWVATSVALDPTKRAAWAAQAATTPYAVPSFTSSQALPAGTNGTAGYTFTITVASDLGGGLVKISLGNGATDATHVAGLVLTDNGNGTATLAGTPNATGTFSFVVVASDELGGANMQVCSLTIAAAATASFVLPANPPVQPAVNVPFSWNVAQYAQNITGTKTFTSASLPNHHLSISSAGLITGTPLAADAGKTFTVAVTVTNGAGTTISSSVRMTIPAVGAGFSITTTVLPALQQSSPMATTQLVVSGGSGLVASGSVSAGTLPAGLALTVAFGTAALSGTPTGTGAYDFTVSLTDSSTPAQTATVQYTGTIAPAATAAAFSPPSDLTAVAGSPKVGDKVDIPLAQFVTPSGTPAVFDSGSPATTPGAGLDVVSGHYMGTANTATTVNPLLRASFDGGSTWLPRQCHLTLIQSVPGIDVSKYLAKMVLGDNIAPADALQNMSTLAAAITAAESQKYRLYSSQGTDSNPVLIGLHRNAWKSAPYLGSSKIAWWDLGNVLFYLLAGQPGNMSEVDIIRVTNISKGVFNVNLDIRNGQQTVPSDIGQPGFYCNGFMSIGGDHESGKVSVFNGIGLTGNTSNGTSETFDVKLGQSGGGADLEVVLLGNCAPFNIGTPDVAHIRTYTDKNGAVQHDPMYASGLVVHQTVETDALPAPRSWFKLTADKRRHAFGEYSGGPAGIRGGSKVTHMSARGIAVEDGTPNANAVRSPSLWIGEPGTTTPVVTQNNPNGIATANSGGGLIGEIIVNCHESDSDNVPYQIGGVGTTTIRNSTVTSPKNGIISGVSGGGRSATQNLANVTVDTATSTVHGLSGSQVRPSGQSIKSGSWRAV